VFEIMLGQKVTPDLRCIINAKFADRPVNLLYKWHQ